MNAVLPATDREMQQQRNLPTPSLGYCVMAPALFRIGTLGPVHTMGSNRGSVGQAPERLPMAITGAQLREPIKPLRSVPRGNLRVPNRQVLNALL